MARLASQGATVPTSNSPTDQNSRQYQMLRSQRPSTADQVLQDMIDEELVRLEDEKRGIVVTQDEIEARMNSDLAKQQAVVADARNANSAPDAAAAPGPTATPTKVPTLTAEAFETAYQEFLEPDQFYATSSIGRTSKPRSSATSCAMRSPPRYPRCRSRSMFVG